MKASLSWLRQYLDIPGQPDHIAEMLTGCGLEVESVEDQARAFDGIVVGHVLTCDKHPKADKLSVCTVDDGHDVWNVVCGAPNVAAGQRVAFATLGAYIASAGFRIEKRVIRGAESSGMLCSAAELGITDDHSGIMVLEGDAPVGTPLSEYLGRTDVTFEIGITPNRGDALSHIGIARDLAALLGHELHVPELNCPAILAPEVLPITIHDPSLCSRYSGAVLRGVAVKPSPAWLANALESVGIRSINTIVDVTNFVMLEMGQPMHAFDFATLAGPSIIVRGAEQGESFTTLDGRTHALPANTILICDAEKPVALGGVMGGLNSEIKDWTTDVLLESAHFRASSIRRTAKNVAVSSESSYRFERMTDPEATITALRRAVDIILEIAGGTLAGMNDVYPSPSPGRNALLRIARTEALLGISIGRKRMKQILESLQFAVTDEGDDLRVQIPSFRPEVEREVDIVEEIARIHGYDNIPAPAKIEITTQRQYDDLAPVSAMRQAALGLGFDEVVSSSLVPQAHAVLESEARVIDVKNPVSAERPSLRTSLLSSLLEAADVNIRNGIDSMRLFEIGTVFEQTGPLEIGLASVRESTHIAFLLTGSAQSRSWYASERPFDMYDLKGVVTAFLSTVRIDIGPRFSYDRQSSLSESVLSIEIDGNIVGRIIEVPENIRKVFTIDQSVFVADFDVNVLTAFVRKDVKYRAPSRYPSVKRDLAFLVPLSCDSDDIIKAAQRAASGTLVEAETVDVFQHESFGADKKSMAITLTFQSSEKTLAEADIVTDISAIVAEVARSVGGSLRV